MNWHSKKSGEVFRELYSGPEGLKEQNVKTRQIKFGPNELQAKKKKSPVTIFLRQFNSFIVWILVVAAGISYLLHDKFESVLIGIILLLNAVFGFWQEFKAEKSIEALKQMAALKAKVIRNGQEMKIDAKELVPGDIIVLETGDKVPADALLFEATQLETDESSLTGESVPMRKDIGPVGEVSLAERTCIVHASTIVTKGRARAVVVETGMNTEIGKIAGLVQEKTEKLTPLQHKLTHLGEVLGIGTLVVCAVIFVTLYFRTDVLLESIEEAIALAVAAIPEGLAAVVTICLALGVRRMVKKNALVRVLPAVETLGSCDVICTDKTGTLTYNQMTVREFYTDNKTVHVTGHGYVPEGQFLIDKKQVKPNELLLQIGALCNDAKLEKQNKWEIFGDPTEAALIVAAKKAGLDSTKLNQEMPRVDEIPFDSARKLMTTIHKTGSKHVAYVKGAPDILIHKCNRIIVNGKVKKLDAVSRKSIEQKNEGMAGDALRVLGFAYRDVTPHAKDIENNLIFVGLMGMIDPPRNEVVGSIAKCKGAGIKVVMITGDHKATAVAIGNELGLTGGVLTGQEIDILDSLNKVVESTTIYARVSPQHKMRIINALKSKGHVVSMTGDGVNDAPALKKADIGVAMGISGTDVSKEASDMILTDDNFSSIVNAVEEGRGIYENIRKFVRYLLSSNTGEVLTIFTAVLIGVTGAGGYIAPLTAVQLLWINLLTDSFPALALGVEPADPDIMNKKPRKTNEKIINRSYAIDMFLIGFIMAAGTLFVFYQGLKVSEQYAVTMAFSTLVVFQLFNVLNCKSDTKSIFKIGLLNNKWLIAAIGFSLSLQFIAVYAPSMYDALSRGFGLPAYDLSEKLGTIAINFTSWLVVFAVGSTVLIFQELKKVVQTNV